MPTETETSADEVNTVADAICEALAQWITEPLHLMAYQDAARAAISKRSNQERKPQMTDLEKAREAFLSMIADAGENFQEQPDGDVNDSGRMIDCTTYKLITGHRQFEELCDALGITRARYDESLMDAIDRHIQLPA